MLQRSRQRIREQLAGTAASAQTGAPLWWTRQLRSLPNPEQERCGQVMGCTEYEGRCRHGQQTHGSERPRDRTWRSTSGIPDGTCRRAIGRSGPGDHGSTGRRRNEPNSHCSWPERTAHTKCSRAGLDGRPGRAIVGSVINIKPVTRWLHPNGADSATLVWRGLPPWCR